MKIDRNALAACISDYTVVDRSRLDNLADLAAKVQHVYGDVVECGVARGGTAAWLYAAMKPDPTDYRHLWLYDKFDGLPEPTEPDGQRAWSYVGQNQSSIEIVHEALYLVNADFRSVTIHKGLFDTTFHLPFGPNAIAFLHIDADWYESVYACLTRWYDQVSEGGVIVLDDFGFWPGCRLAFARFFAERGFCPDVHRHSDQAYWFKEPYEMTRRKA